MKNLLLATIFAGGSITAHAEIFTCKQADGTTVFSHVPCREDKPRPVLAVPVYVEPEIEIRDYLAEIAAIETQLDGLRKAREMEIANALYSTSNPDLLYETKAEIRASYQLRIDEKLSELIDLRTRQRAQASAE